MDVQNHISHTKRDNFFCIDIVVDFKLPRKLFTQYTTPGKYEGNESQNGFPCTDKSN